MDSKNKYTYVTESPSIFSLLNSGSRPKEPNATVKKGIEMAPVSKIFLGTLLVKCLGIQL